MLLIFTTPFIGFSAILASRIRALSRVMVNVSVSSIKLSSTIDTFAQLLLSQPLKNKAVDKGWKSGREAYRVSSPSSSKEAYTVC